MFFRTIPMTKLIRKTADTVDTAQSEPVFISRTGGKPGAVLISEKSFKALYAKAGHLIK